MKLVRALDEVSLADVAECGGKAGRLGEALRLGCPVPDGRVLTTALFRRFMEQGGLQGEIASILAVMQPSAITHFQAAEWAIREAFKVRRIPPEVLEAIQEAYRAFQGQPIAVRSSAINEDGARQSFVGQHASCLDVTDEEGAVVAVLECWMSLFSARALCYARRFGVDLLNSSMAVLLQRMIHPTAKGALSTADPLTGNPDVFVLEVSEGPDQAIVRLDPYERQPGEVAVWGQLRRIGLLLDERELAYQVVEWAIADEKLHILRTYPVTRVAPYLPVTSAHLGSKHGPLELVHAPAATRRALRPYSWYHRSRSQRLNAACLREAYGLFQPSAARDEHYLHGYLYTRYVHLTPTPDGLTQPSLRNWLRSLRYLYVGRTLDREYRLLEQAKRQRLEQLGARDLRTLSPTALAQHLREVIGLTEEFVAQWGRVHDGAWAIPEVLQQLHQRWLGNTRDCQVLLYGMDDQVTRRDEALRALAQTTHASAAEGEEAFQAFFRRHRQLFVVGQPLDEEHDVALLHEDEESARALLHAWTADGGRAVRERHRRMLEERTQAERRIMHSLNRFQRLIYRWVLNMAQRYAPLRNDCREPVLLCLLLERDTVHEVGQRLVAEEIATAPEDAALLGAHELLSWLEGGHTRDELVGTLMQRRDLYRRWWRYGPPDVLEDETHSPSIELPLIGATEHILQGQPVSTGTAQGRVRVIGSLSEASRVLPGEVLVCREPLFELTPLYSMVAALVAEVGGLLDHPAVLAREYGIPAILGVERATQRLRQGEEVLVDANQGLVVREQPEVEWDLL